MNGKNHGGMSISNGYAVLPTPEINYAFAGLMITFQARIGEKVGETGKISPETREKTREKILKLILEDTSISIKEMSNRIGITQKGVEWQIMRLKKDGILKRIGPASGKGVKSKAPVKAGKE